MWEASPVKEVNHKLLVSCDFCWISSSYFQVYCTVDVLTMFLSNVYLFNLYTMQQENYELEINFVLRVRHEKTKHEPVDIKFDFKPHKGGAALVVVARRPCVAFTTTCSPNEKQHHFPTATCPSKPLKPFCSQCWT